MSGDTKDALARETVTARHCRSALRDGLLRFGVAPGQTAFRTQRPAVARLAWSLLEDRTRAIRKLAGVRLQRRASYEIDVAWAQAPARSSARCDRRMELRGAFLACGSLCAPARGYHLEFVPPDEAAAERLAALLRAEGFEPKRGNRRDRPLVYFKDAETIAAVLAAIGAGAALLHLEDVRAFKETKNRIRRLVNTEAANVDRATSAAATQRAAIALVADAIGLQHLLPALREVAELRLAHPSDTLAELGRRCQPPVNKSTVGGRLATLVRLAAAPPAGTLRSNSRRPPRPARESL